MSDKLFYVRCQGDGSWLNHAFGKGSKSGDIFTFNLKEAVKLTETEAKRFGYPQPMYPLVPQLKAEWAVRFQPLVGRKIVAVRWMTDKEQEANSWFDSPIVIILDDGTAFWPSADDEGNNAGALFVSPSIELKRKGVEEIAPVISQT